MLDQYIPFSLRVLSGASRRFMLQMNGCIFSQWEQNVREMSSVSPPQPPRDYVMTSPPPLPEKDY